MRLPWKLRVLSLTSKVIEFLRRNIVLTAALFLAVGVALAVAMVATGEFAVNIGFLMIGALFSFATGMFADWQKRPQQARDLANALHAELADRVARCCFDFEEPWSRLATADETMHVFRARKFVPVSPVVYPAIASQIALLSEPAPRDVIQFYYRLAAWQRDLENAAREGEKASNIMGTEALHFLSPRLGQTLAPGLAALTALGPLVDRAEEREAAALAGYDVSRAVPAAEPSLRKRLSWAISSA